MLENLYDTFSEKYPDSQQAWNGMLIYIASVSAELLLAQIKDEIGWLVGDSDLVQRATRIYDPVLMQEDTADSLGSFYRELSSDFSSGRPKTPILADETEHGIEAVLYGSASKVMLLDLHAGTGRLLLLAHKLIPNGILLGVEPELGAYRVGLTNFAIHGVHGYVLHADPQIHATDLDSEEGRHNWEYANRWHSQIDNLLPITPPKPK